MNGWSAATLVMTLGTYPLVYLPVAAALRRADPAMEDTAHSLGAGRLDTFLRVTLPLIRTAVLGGCVLVVLTVISEYGAFEILRYQTFTTEIFTEFQFDSRAAAALSVPLVCLACSCSRSTGSCRARAATRTAPARPASAGTTRMDRRPDRCCGLAALVALAIGVPIGTHRLLDGPEPAHDAAGGGHAGPGHAGTRSSTALLGATVGRRCSRCPWR